ncbi:hypothetical protein [Solitalea koreensis]|uniref:Uncharacterized protein n=1 Tax=Solitalea koreensis TaxID=543615 RepID=A0A521ACD4_9SPHI|nr:hypothetical protein [Solitalea koreensis]SMO32469.1 hypothetical protein SAMN06265350_10153 [Solitalea koreensis]
MIKKLFIALAVLIGIGLLLLVIGFPGNMILGIWGLTGVFGIIFIIIWLPLKVIRGPRKSNLSKSSSKSSSKSIKNTSIKRKVNKI